MPKKARKQQSRLAFTPLPSSSPASKDYHKQIRDRAANVSLESISSPAKRRKAQQEQNSDMASPEADEIAMPTPANSREKPASREVDSAEDSDDQPIRPTPRPTKRKTRPRQKQLDFSNTRDPDSFDTAVKLTSSSPRRTQSTKSGIFSSQAQGQIFDISSDDDSDASGALLSPRKILTRAKKADKDKTRRAIRSSRPVATEENDDEDEDEVVVSSRRSRPQQVQEASDDDEDDMPTTQGKQRRKRKRAPSKDSFISDSPPRAALDSDDDLEIVEAAPSRKRRRQASESEEDDEDDAPKTPGQRRLKKQPRHLSKEEQDDLADDLNWLGPSSDVEEGRNPRSSQSTQKSERQKALDWLKQKRSGKLPQVEEDDEEQEEEAADSEQEEDVQEISDDDNDDDVQEVPKFPSSRQFFQEDEEDADFLVEEGEDDPLGVPEGLPLEFTRYASMKAKELFKYVVDYYVQRKLNPAFEKNDQLYDLAFKKLDDEVRGLAGSKFTSAAWTSDFTLALQARPEIAYERIDRTSAQHFLRDKCDACNRSGHPATYQVQFQGLPYDKHTLEEFTQDDGDSDSEIDSDDNEETKHDDDAPDWDKEGRQIVPINTIFYVGKFCKSNAETAHRLQHWRHSLNDHVENMLIRDGYTTARELEKRDKWSTTKRRKYANKVVDLMEKNGEVRVLWRAFRENIDQARNAKQGRFKAASP